jgi:hypothetical protein
VKEKLLAIAWYFYDRFMEPSSWKGIIWMISGGGWKALDGTSKGEALAQWGMILLGAIQFLLPQKTQYKINEPSGR